MSGVLRIDRLEPVGFITPIDFAVAQADDCKSFGNAPAGAVPPVSTDRATRDVGDTPEADNFVDVSVALENREGVVLFKQGQHLPGIGHGKLRMADRRGRSDSRT